MPNGRVPLLAGQPHWPWDDEVAHQRLDHVAARLGITLSGNESRLDGASNDTWLIGDRVLRVCWRGDLDRMRREAELISALPPEVPCPRPVDHGRDEHLSWLLMPRVRGTTLAAHWPTAPESQLREHVAALGRLLATLRSWAPPEHVRTMIESAEPTDADDALAITGKRLIPMSPAHQFRLVDYARTMPFVDGGLLDAVAERLLALHGRLAVRPSEFGFLHADATPGNILVHEGRITALLDYEWSCFGPLDAELVLPRFWVRCQPRDARAHRFVDWLREDYPASFAVADFAARQWLYQAVFALRCAVHWPPTVPEHRLDPDHPVLLLRELVKD